MGEDEIAAVDPASEGMRVLETHAAATREPHVADEDWRGEPRIVPESLRHIACVGADQLFGDPCRGGRDGGESPAVFVPLGPVPEATEGEAG